MSGSPWFPFWRPRPAARVRLLCFPYAGIGCGIYRDWPDRLPAWVDVVGIQPPGRETRTFEPPCRRLDELVARIGEAIAPLLDRPIALFGHSLGALVAWELGRAAASGPPSCLIASARRAPHLPAEAKLAIGVPEDRRLETVRRVFRIPPEALADDEFRSHILPTLIAELELHDSHAPSPPAPSRVPLTVLGATGDDTIAPGELEAWRELTSAAFRLVWLEGDHHYLDARPAALFAAVTAALEEAITR